MFSPSLSPRRLIAVAVAAACATYAAQADEFSWQLSGGVRQADVGDLDSDSWAIDATYYMNPIADSDGPYELASFLNPTTRVSAAASGNDSGLDFVDDPTAYTLSGTYVLPGAKWYVGAEYAKSHADDPPFASISDPKGYGVHAGRYLGANTTLELRMGRSEQESSLSCSVPVLCLVVPSVVETTMDTVGLEVFHVRRFRSLTYTLEGSVVEREVEAEFSSPFPLPFPLQQDGPSLRQYSVAAELFPLDRLGVRVGYTRPEDFDFHGYDVAATWFFKPRVAVQFGMSRATNDDAPPGLRHSDSAGVRFIGRL